MNYRSLLELTLLLLYSLMQYNDTIMSYRKSE